MKYLQTLCLSFFISISFAQENHFVFSFQRNDSISVLNAQQNRLLLPWIGGFNSVYLSSLDLDLDGNEDLFLFEKHGDRIIPLISVDSNSWRYAPEFISKFPLLHDWAFCKDFNHDGKKDLFTYGLAGISVFVNNSQNELHFDLLTPQLLSFYYNDFANIFASPDDYLAIEDMDGDGDFDILNFWLLGKYVHMQKNLSVENFGTCDSLHFTLGDDCWGAFSEASDNNEITLFTDCQNKDVVTQRHIGSSIFAHDFTGNGLKDIVVGDVDYPGLILLENNGTLDEALIVNQTTNFPNAQDPITLFSMPSINMVDVDHDGIEELIASPSDPSLTKSQDLNSVWLYHRPDTMHPFSLECKNFLQSDCIDVGSGAKPILYDWNNDGLIDLFICNYGSYDSTTMQNGIPYTHFSSSITFYLNIGTASNPAFQWITSDFGNLKTFNYQALYVTFGDLNEDGKTDLLCGNADGTLTLFYAENTSNTPIFSDPILHWQSIDVGEFSTPQLFDLENDGYLDLLIGNRRGFVAYYKKNSAASVDSDFELISEQLGGVDVRDFNTSYFGYSTPCFFRFSNQTFLFCGTEQGTVYQYSDIDNNLSGIFNRTNDLIESFDQHPSFFNDGIRSGVAVNDLNADSFPDAVVGNWAGGVVYLQGISPLPSAIPEFSSTESPFTVYPNPVSNTLNIDFEENIPAECILFNPLGIPVFDAQLVSNHNIISLPNLPDGLYFLRINFINGNVLKKNNNSSITMKKVIIFANK